MLIITTLIACILAALFLRLSFGVIRLRRHHKVGLGSGGVDDLERAIRAQANFAEYVPIALIPKELISRRRTLEIASSA
jgi:uncharacterized membrane protein YecN with MAPEG domain